MVGLKKELMDVREAPSSVWSKAAPHVSRDGVFPRGRNEVDKGLLSHGRLIPSSAEVWLVPSENMRSQVT